MESMLGGLNLVALGGLAAAVFAGWQQIKGFMAYLTSFVIVQAHYDHSSSVVMTRHLKRHWQRLPGSQIHYATRGFIIPKSMMELKVPFHAVYGTTVYRRGWRVLIAKHEGNGLKVTAVRGLVSLDSLMIEALHEDLLEANSQSKKRQDRFQVIKVVGSEKTPGGGYSDNSGRRRRGDSLSGGIDAQAQEEINTAYRIEHDIETSFAFSRDQYMFEQKNNPFETLYLPEPVMKVIRSAREWFDERQWYEERMIPWRRGILMIGEGGTGKSSTAKALARELGIPLYQFFLATMSDQELIAEWEQMATPCAALLEDIDTVFNKRESLTEHKSLTFDCLLNVLSGVATRNGVLTLVTTNRPEFVDDALGAPSGSGENISTRPGRLDLVVEFPRMGVPERLKLAQRILQDWEEEIEPAVKYGYEMTPVQFQEYCVQIAMKCKRKQIEVNL